MAGARTLRLTDPFTTGEDVAELQRLLEPYEPGAVDGVFGPATAAAVERAKHALGYVRCDEAAGTRLLARLRRAAADTRARIVDAARWGIANEAAIHYEELRPIEGLDAPRTLPLRTDCSGFVTLCYAWAGAPDPNGLGFSGQGWTGTLLAHMRPVALADVRPGDLVVWGEPPGHHVALVLEPGAADPLLCSHGQERGPLAIRFSEETRHQPPPATWLACLP